MSEEQKKKFSLAELPMWWWLASGLMLAVWMLTPTVLQTLYGLVPEKKMGAYADSYGFVTSLFTVVATMLILAGLMLQRRELAQLQDALGQQANQAVKQNNFTEQQMAFQQLEARIASIPSLSMSCKGDVKHISDVYGKTSTIIGESIFTLENQGATIFNVKIHVNNDQSVGLDHGQTLVQRAIFAIMANNVSLSFRVPFRGKGVEHILRLTYVDRFAERHEHYFPLEEGKTCLVNDFYHDASKVKSWLTSRFPQVHLDDGPNSKPTKSV